jgi:hypothetical protein
LPASALTEAALLPLAKSVSVWASSCFFQPWIKVGSALWWICRSAPVLG